MEGYSGLVVPRRNALPVLCLLAAFLGLEASADNPNDSLSADQAKLDTLTVIAGKAARPLREVAATVSVITSEQMDRQLVQDIKDVVRYQAGVTVGNDPSRFGLDGFNIRGIEGNRITVELDGVPVSDRFAIGNFSNAGRDFVDPEILSRIEILRGPASTLYGSDAIGGVVAYTTKDPSDLLGLTRERTYVNLKGGYYGDDGSLMGTATAALGGDRVGGLLSLTHRSGHELDNADGASGTEPNPADHDRTTFLGKLVLDMPAGGALRMILDTDRAERATNVQALVGAPGRFINTTSMVADDRQKRTRLSLEQTVAPQLLWTDQTLWRVFYQSSDTEQLTMEERAASSSTPFPTLIERAFAYEQSSAGGEVTLANLLSAGRSEHRVVYGLEGVFSQIEEQRDGQLTNLDDGTTTNVIIGESFPVRDFPVTETVEWGLYAQDEISFGGPLTIIPGLRYEYYDLEPQPDAVYVEDNPSTTATSLSASNLSPKFGLIYRLSNRFTFFSQYARGFRSPPFEDVNIGLEIPMFNVRAIPNPELKPESSDGIDTGLRVHSRSLQGSLALFYNAFDDFIESKVNLGPDPDSGVLLFQSQNIAKARTYGFELAGRYAPDFAAPALQGLHFDVNMALIRGEDEQTGQPLNSVPPDQLIFGLGYEPLPRRWGLQLMTTWTAAKERVNDPGGDLFRTPSYTLLDLLGYYQISTRASFNWALFNLTDEQYWDWADVRGRPADDPSLDLFMRPGFNASVSFRWQW